MLKQPHDHIAAQYCQKTGSAFQSFAPRRRKVTAWEVVSTVVTVAVALIVICSLPMGQW